MENKEKTQEELVETPISQLTQFQQEALDEAEKELESLKKELETRKYLVDLDKNLIKVLQNFIYNDAPWKFTEALGIIEVKKEFVAVEKTGKLFIKGLTVEAIYYYISKVEGNGLTTKSSSFTTIESYLAVVKAITTTLEKIKLDNESLREKEFTVAARREGLNLDSEETTDSIVE